MNGQPATDRETYLDNARGLLLLLVIVGHLLEPVRQARGVTSTAYILIYLFHMPALAAISGMLSRPDLTRGRVGHLLLRLLLPYLVFTAIVLAVAGCSPGEFGAALFTRCGGLWYLLSLFGWRLMLPLVARIPFAATLSVPAAVLTGYVPWIGVRFSLARTLAFLPFFLAGYRLRGSGRTPLLRAVPAPLAAAALLLAGTAAFVWRWTDVEKWLWCHAAYAILGRPEWWAGAARLGVLAGAAGLGAAVLSLVPASENLLTRFGRRALYIYVLHMVVIEVLVKAGFYSAVSPLLLTALAAPLALGLALVLSSEPVRTLTMCLVDVPAFVAMCRQKVANRRLRPPSGP